MKFMRFLGQTEREQSASIDGINLFFGALLGANLGVATGLELPEYIKLIVLLVVLVMLIRVAAHATRVLVPLAFLGGYVALILALYLSPADPPDGMTVADLHRLLATILIWVAATVLVMIQPTKDEPA